MSQTRRAGLGALSIAALAAMFAAPATAQPAAQYCAGVFVAERFYALQRPLPSGQTQMLYFLDLRNTTGQERVAMLNFYVPPTVAMRVTGLVQSGNRVPANTTVQIRLGTQNLDNSSGIGAVSASALKDHTRVDCR
jgi:hypothetical protein